MAHTLINIKKGPRAGSYVLVRRGYKTYNIYEYENFVFNWDDSLKKPLELDFYGTKRGALKHFRILLNYQQYE